MAYDLLVAWRVGAIRISSYPILSVGELIVNAPKLNVDCAKVCAYNICMNNLLRHSLTHMRAENIPSFPSCLRRKYM